jgi:hypothetical protein
MGKFDLSSIKKGVENRPPRMILLGSAKVGKSTVAGQAPNPIFLPIKGEEGIDALDVSKFPVAETYDDVKEAIRTLIEEEHDFQTLVIDSSSALEPLIWKRVCEEAKVDSIEKVGGGYGKGYTEAVNKWQFLAAGLDAIREKGIATIIIGHISTGTFNDPMTDSYTRYAWDINQKAASLMYRWADCILFANTKTYTKSEEGGFNKKEVKATSSGTRYLYTQERPTHPGGGRGVFGQLPYEIELSYDAWYKAVLAEASNKNK